MKVKNISDNKLLLKSLEISAAYNCSLTCRGCSHASPLEAPIIPNHEEILQTVHTLSKYLHCHVLRILGGEPTLNSQLHSLINGIRKSDIADGISFATNGLNLERAEEIAALVDWFELSNYRYSKKYSQRIEQWAQRMVDRYRVCVSVYYFESFREPFALMSHTDPNKVNSIYKACIIAHKWQCWNIRDGWLFKCPQSIAISQYVLHCPFSVDGIQILDDGTLGERLLIYFDKREPLNACHYCLGSCGKRFPITQCTCSNWLSHQNYPASKLLDEPFLLECLSSDVWDIQTVSEVKKFIPDR